MKQMLANVFTSPRTTFAGLWTVVMAPALGEVIVPQVVAYFNGQPGLGWKLVGYVLALVVPALMPDKKASQLSAVP